MQPFYHPFRNSHAFGESSEIHACMSSGIILKLQQRARNFHTGLALKKSSIIVFSVLTHQWNAHSQLASNKFSFQVKNVRRQINIMTQSLSLQQL